MRPAPRLFDRLPEQYFTRILAAAAAARAQDGPGVRRFIDLGRGNPDLPPPPHAIEALRPRRSRRRRPRCTATRRSTASPTCARRSPSATRPTTASSSTPIARSPSCRGRRRASCSRAPPRPGAATRSCCPTPATPTTRPASRWRARPRAAAARGERRLAAGLRRGRRRAPRGASVLNYPSNPCAVVRAPTGTFERAVGVARERDAWLIHDLAYGFLAFDGRRARSVLEADGARDVRAGAVVAVEDLRDGGLAGWLRRRQRRAGGAGPDAARPHRGGRLHRAAARARGGAARRPGRRRRAPRGLPGAGATGWWRRCAAAGAEIDTPEGTFYAWWRLPEGLDGRSGSRRGARGRRAGEGFGARGAGWARLSLAMPDADLAEAAERLAAVIEGTASR